MKNPTSAMLSVDEALARLLAPIEAVQEIESIGTLKGAGRVLAEPIIAPMNVPEHDNSQMDGYAVRSADCSEAGARLQVSQRIAAGHVGRALAPGTAARIFTGAIVPDGADAIVMQEETEAGSSTAGEFVTIKSRPTSGDWIRRVGEDIREGSIILDQGVQLKPQMLGLAASVGVAQLKVRRRVRVALVFTGDELAMPGEPLGPGKIYNSSRFTLTALVESLGLEVIDMGIVADTLAATRAALREASEKADCIVTSGGVSDGEEDHIKPAVEAEGRLDLWQIAVKPGKPLAFGRIGGAWFLGLPGNPVSSFVTFLVFVRPLLQKLAGVAQAHAPAHTLRADFNWPRPDRREEFLRVRHNRHGGLDLFPNQGSAVLTSTVWGDGLVRNPPGRAIAPGDLVQFLPFASLGA